MFGMTLALAESWKLQHRRYPCMQEMVAQTFGTRCRACKVTVERRARDAFGMRAPYPTQIQANIPWQYKARNLDLA